LDVFTGVGEFWEKHPKYSFSDVREEFNYQVSPPGTIGLNDLKFIKWIREMI